MRYRLTASWIVVAPMFCLGTAVAQSGSLVERGSPLHVVEPDATDRDLRMTPVVRAVQRAADSVVSIYLENQLAGRGEPRTEGQGSGVILDESGLVITNWHVIAPLVLGGARGNVEAVIKLRDGRTRQAKVLSSSAKRDLALLQLKLQGEEKVKPIEIGRSGTLMIGETVIAIGNPQGHANTVTSGVLSAIDRSIRVRTPDGEVRDYSGLMQTDAAINQGNSGGALLDITGRLIGINNAMAMGAENIGFAIPMDTVREEFQRELLQSISFSGAAELWLGIEVADRDGTVVVDKVVFGSPAQLAGVQVGDVLTSIGKQPVKSSLDYLRHFFEARPQEAVPLLLRRDGREVPASPMPVSRDEGLVLTTIGAAAHQIDYEADAALVRKATIAFNEGRRNQRVRLPSILQLHTVHPDGPAAAIGLQAGDIVLSVIVRQGFADREVPLTTLRDFATLLDQNRGKSLRIGILRGDDALQGTLDVKKTRN